MPYDVQMDYLKTVDTCELRESRVVYMHVWNGNENDTVYTEMTAIVSSWITSLRNDPWHLYSKGKTGNWIDRLHSKFIESIFPDVKAKYDNMLAHVVSTKCRTRHS